MSWKKINLKNIEDSGEKIVSRINELPIDTEFQIEIEHIRDLEKRLDELKKQVSQKVYAGGGGGGGELGGHVRYYDISSQLNGVLKKFSLPAFGRVLLVQSSSFPNAFRETTDYVADGSAFTIEFTSEISAGSTLATGQTITILYATQ